MVTHKATSSCVCLSGFLSLECSYSCQEISCPHGTVDERRYSVHEGSIIRTVFHIAVPPSYLRAPQLSGQSRSRRLGTIVAAARGETLQWTQRNAQGLFPNFWGGNEIIAQHAQAKPTTHTIPSPIRDRICAMKNCRMFLFCSSYTKETDPFAGSARQGCCTDSTIHHPRQLLRRAASSQ